MIAVMWADWQDFRRQSAWFVFGMTGLVLSFGLAAGSLQPVVAALVVQGLSFGLGWAYGSQNASSRKSWEWVGEARVPIVNVLLGKALGLILATGATLLFVSPLLVLTALVTGVSFEAMLWTLGWSLVVGLWALGVALLVNQNPATLLPFLGLAGLALLLTELTAVAELRITSPLWQLWQLYQTADGSPGSWALAGHALALLALGAVTTFAYRLNPRFR